MQKETRQVRRFRERTVAKSTQRSTRPRTIAIIGWVALAAVLLIGVRAFLIPRGSERPAPTSSLSPAASSQGSISDPAREKRRDVWFAAAEGVVSRTGDFEAKEILTWMKKNAILARPHALGGHQFLEASQTQDWFAISVVMQSDADLGPKVTEFMAQEQGGGALFNPDVHMMVVRDYVPMTHTWRGLLFLHEGFHAYSYAHEPYDWRDPRTFCHAERETHAFENRLIAKLGGTAYKSYLTAEMARMKQVVEAKGHQVGRADTGLTSLEGLDKIFGSPKSEFERNLRWTHCSVDANFRLIDQYWVGSQGDKEEQKALYLKTHYRKLGLLPGG